MKRGSAWVFVVAGTLALLTVGAGWSARSMLHQRSEARYMSEQLAESKRIAAQIEQLASGPKIARDASLDLRLINDQISDAARKAGVDPNRSIDSVRPEGGRPVGDTDYLRKPTTFSLRNMTLTQIVMLLHHLQSADPTLNISDLRLRTPHGVEEPDVWNAEATVSYLIFDDGTD